MPALRPAKIAAVPAKSFCGGARPIALLVRLKTIMPHDPTKHHRRSIRLKHYDYSQAGAYYFTIVAQHRALLFGDIIDAAIQLNDPGRMLWQQWLALPQRFPYVELDEFVVMPNHVHGIILITEQLDNPRRGAPLWSPDLGLSDAAAPVSPPEQGQAQGTAPTQKPTLGNILGAWKSLVTNQYINGVHHLNWQPFERKLFQRDYWEHIIRTDNELEMIREYIANNPANWNADDQNPNNQKTT